MNSFRRDSASTNGLAADSRATWRSDFLASIVVFLVALPLCMGIAIASGAPVAAGLITGIVGGLVVGFLAGSPLQVSGPAAGLTVLVYDIVQRHGLEMMGLVVLIAGCLQLLAGIFRLGQWFRAVSPAVIKGMLAGIGVLIFVSQFHVMMDEKPKGSGIQNLLAIPETIGKSLQVPELDTADVRKLKTQELRKIGELHRRQVLLQERLAEQIPHHHVPPTPPPLATETADAEVPDFTPYFESQVAISQQLEEAIRELQQLRTEAAGNGKAQRIHEMADRALTQSRLAQQELREGAGLAILESQAAAARSLEGLLSQLKNHGWAAEIGVLTILVILLWQGFAPKKLKVVPAPLVAVIVATAAAAAITLPVLYVEVPDNLLKDVHSPTLVVLKDAPWMALLQAGLVVAIIASAETLLCATAVDQMHQGPRTKYDRELWAQGVGNMVCGLLGALPMTGVIVRSAANVQAGGKSRLSAILHGVWLCLFVLVLAFVLRMIPTASLAAMLVYTGYKLVNPAAIRELWKYGKGEVAIYAATVGTIVVQDLLAGVIVGIVLSGLKLLYTFSHLKTRLSYDRPENKATLSLEGAATFIRLPKLAEELDRVPQSAELHVDMHQLDYIDHACLDLLMNWARCHEATGGRLIVDWDSLHARFKRDTEPAVSHRSPPHVRASGAAPAEVAHARE